MKNIAIKAIVALLLVVSLGYSRDMNCRSEWFPMVKELAPEFSWEGKGASKVKNHPKDYLCGVFHNDDGLPVYAAIGKKLMAQVILVQRDKNDNGWKVMAIFERTEQHDPERQMLYYSVDAYGIESASFGPIDTYYDLKRLAIDLIAID